MASELINKHATRVLANSGTDMDLTWLASIDSWISSEGLLPYLIDWSSAASGAIKNGSNQVSRAFGLGTTWLPRLGDLAPSVLANCVYDATGINSKPCWTISNGQYMYYGTARGGTIRLENIRRIHRQGFTVVAVYQEAHGFGQGIFAYGQNRIYLTATTSGATFKVGNGSAGVTDTVSTSLPSSASHVVGGTFDQDVAIAYADGVAGSGASGYIAAATNGTYGQYRPLMGGAKGRNEQIYYQLGIGSFSTGTGIYNNAPTTSTVRTVTGGTGAATVKISEIIIFSTCLTPAQMGSLNTLLRTRY